MTIGGIRGTEMYSPMQKANSQRNVNEMQEKEREKKEVNEELSSGKKVNDAADDAAIMAIAQKMLSSHIGLETRNNIIDNELGRFDVADGALSNVQDTLGRMNELTMQASNGIMTDADKAMIQAEVDELSSQLSSTFSNTEFNTKALFEGEIASMDVKSLGLEGFDVTNPDALNQLKGAAAQVSSLQGQIGADYNGLEHEQKSNAITSENTLSSLSQMQDTDYAESSSALIKNNILSQYQMQMQGNIIQQMSSFQLAI